MPFKAKVFRIFLSGPSDVVDVRNAAVQVINEWNYAYAIEQGVFLEPVQWETHVAPEFGNHPQTIINTRLVEKCDLLVGVFWTRFGSRTEHFGSGTEEEIEYFLKRDRPVMLYFSDQEISPSQIDGKQSKRVNAFKKKKASQGIYWAFKTLADFKTTFKGHLIRHVQRLKESVTVSDADGLASMEIAWSCSVSDEFLLAKGDLTIKVKDGFTFFSKRSAVLKKRFSNPRHKTMVLMVHPDYEHLAALADSDPEKRGEPEIQRNDCICSVKEMQLLRATILHEIKLDIAKTVTFMGYRSSPTWAGILGPVESSIGIYNTRCYRGELLTMRIVNRLGSGEQSMLYKHFIKDVDETIRVSRSNRDSWDLWCFDWRK